MYGGNKHEFVGLKNMEPPSKSSTTSQSSTQICINDDDNDDGTPIVSKSKSKVKTESKSKSKRTLPEIVVQDEVIEEVINEVEGKENKEDTPPDSGVTLPSLNVNYYLDADRKHSYKKGKFRAESRGEDICRRILETFYGVPFPPARPDFLVNPRTMKNLELDMFNPDLMLALEYNGIQHYKYPNVFHKSQEDHDSQKERDRDKIEACKKAGVNLIVVPYTVPHHKLPEYLASLLPQEQDKLCDIVDQSSTLLNPLRSTTVEIKE